jgi:serine/threonine protein kinase
LRTTVACRPSAVAVLFRNMEGLRISHYRILRRLGSGGMGEVYAAEDERLRRNVAIKFISHDKAADEKTRQRFEREAREPLR